MQVLVGLVNRDNMMVIIRRALAQGHRSSLPAEIEYEDLNKNFVSAAARHLISEQQLAVLQVTTFSASWLFADAKSAQEGACQMLPERACAQPPFFV